MDSFQQTIRALAQHLEDYCPFPSVLLKVPKNQEPVNISPEILRNGRDSWVAFYTVTATRYIFCFLGKIIATATTVKPLRGFICFCSHRAARQKAEVKSQKSNGRRIPRSGYSIVVARSIPHTKKTGYRVAVIVLFSSHGAAGKTNKKAKPGMMNVEC